MIGFRILVWYVQGDVCREIYIMVVLWYELFL